MNKDEFLAKMRKALKGNSDCLRGDEQSRVKIIVQLGGNDISYECHDVVICGQGKSIANLHFALRNDTMQEVEVLYEATCSNKALKFSLGQQSEHSGTLQVIPHYAKKGPPPQTTLETVSLECTLPKTRVQEIIVTKFLEGINSGPPQDIINLTVVARLL